MANRTSLDDVLHRLGIARSALGGLGSPGDCVVVYASMLDGFGTPRSDLDVYVISPDGRHDAAAARSQVRDGLDIERWSMAEVESLCRQAAAGNARLDALKVIHRLAAGLPVMSEAPACVRAVHLGSVLERCWRTLALEELASTAGFEELAEHGSGMLTAKRAVTFAALAWCARHGLPIFKDKWVLLGLRRLDPDIAARYWQHQTAGHDTAALLAFTNELIA